MKKIKYLLLIFPLLFLTNVKAEECTNLIDFNDTNMVIWVNPGSSDSYEVLSSTSFRFISPDTRGSGLQIRNISLPVSNINYILSFDVESSSFEPTIQFRKFSGSDSSVSFTNLFITEDSNFKSYKYKISITSGSPATLFWLTFSGKVYNKDWTFKNFKLYLENEYESCVNPKITYTYRFLVDNEVYSTGTVDENTVIELPESPTKDGYTFSGWTLNGEEYTGGAITSDIDIIANFTENQITPTPSTNVDLSVIIPYLILISALIMLFIEINFVRNLFKSRR